MVDEVHMLMLDCQWRGLYAEGGYGSSILSVCDLPASLLSLPATSLLDITQYSNRNNS